MGLMFLQVRRSETGSAANGSNVGQSDGEETGPANRKLCGCNGARKTKQNMDGAEEGSPQVINFQIMFTVAAGNTRRFPAWGGENYSQYDETFMVE